MNKFNLLKGLTCVFVLSMIFASCQKEAVSEQPSATEDVESITIQIVDAPEGLVDEEAIAWATNLEDGEYEEYTGTESESEAIESRWCTPYNREGTNFDGGGCYCCSGSTCGWFCAKECDIYRRYCGGWSGGRYRVFRYTQLRNCSSCP